jgi:hypothetical protein
LMNTKTITMRNISPTVKATAVSSAMHFLSAIYPPLPVIMSKIDLPNGYAV